MKSPWGLGRAELTCILMRGTVSQGDANRSYSDEDQSLSNMEEFDKLQEALDIGGGKQARTLPQRCSEQGT